MTEELTTQEQRNERKRELNFALGYDWLDCDAQQFATYPLEDQLAAIAGSEQRLAAKAAREAARQAPTAEQTAARDAEIAAVYADAERCERRA